MAKTQWTKVDPSDYNLDVTSTSVERCTSVKVEQGLRVQVLRIKPSDLVEATVKTCLEESGTWSKALVTATDRYVYALLIHEE